MSRADIDRLGRIAEEAYFAEDSTSPETFRRTARAILQALREPSDGMCAAGAEANTFDRYDPEEWHASATWRGMIDHLLAD